MYVPCLSRAHACTAWYIGYLRRWIQIWNLRRSLQTISLPAFFNSTSPPPSRWVSAPRKPGIVWAQGTLHLRPGHAPEQTGEACVSTWPATHTQRALANKKPLDPRTKPKPRLIWQHLPTSGPSHLTVAVYLHTKSCSRSKDRYRRYAHRLVSIHRPPRAEADRWFRVAVPGLGSVLVFGG